MIDTTVQEKNIRFPSDNQLQNQSRKQLVVLAHELGISLRQTYQKQAQAYTLHAPETECLSKGKAHKRYEFSEYS